MARQKQLIKNISEKSWILIRFLFEFTYVMDLKYFRHFDSFHLDQRYAHFYKHLIYHRTNHRSQFCSLLEKKTVNFLLSSKIQLIRTIIAKQQSFPLTSFYSKLKNCIKGIHFSENCCQKNANWLHDTA